MLEIKNKKLACLVDEAGEEVDIYEEANDVLELVLTMLEDEKDNQIADEIFPLCAQASMPLVMSEEEPHMMTPYVADKIVTAMVYGFILSEWITDKNYSISMVETELPVDEVVEFIDKYIGDALRRLASIEREYKDHLVSLLGDSSVAKMSLSEIPDAVRVALEKERE